jgi:hypothetical protein
MTEVERIVSRARRGRALFVSAIALLCLAAVGAGGYAIAVNVDQDSQITKVERFSCAKAPASTECQKTKRRSDRHRSIADTCISFWKVGYACPAPDSGVTVRSMRGGDASQPAPTAGQPSEPPASGGNGEGAPPKGGSDETPAPDKTAAGESPPSTTGAGASPPPSTTPGSAPTSTPPAPEKGPEQDPPGLVKEVVKGVGETVKETACSLTGPLINAC